MVWFLKIAGKDAAVIPLVFIGEYSKSKKWNKKNEINSFHIFHSFIEKNEGYYIPLGG